jgi:membrane associated rhomboid family serine protease
MKEVPDGRAFRLPRPGKVLTVALLVVLGVWLAFATGINWGGADPALFELLCGNTKAIVHGEVWRLVTAPMMHAPGTYSHVMLALVGLYFLSPSLEQSWGSARFARFLCVSALIGYGLQMLVELALPSSLGQRLVGEYWFGLGPVLEAIAIAWALSFRGRTVYLLMVLPVSSGMLVLFVLAVSVLALVAGELGPSGLIAPFGGMFAGWLLGGGTPPPWRRYWLKLTLKRHERELRRLDQARRSRVERSGLRVLEGGRAGREAEDSEPPPSDSGPGGRMLH